MDYTDEREKSGVPRRTRTSNAFLLREAPLPIGLPGQKWCCVAASIHAPPRCQFGTLPDELMQHIDRGAGRRNQTSVSSLRGACSVTELCRLRAGLLQINKWAGILLRIPKEAVAQCRAQFLVGRSRWQTTRSWRIAFQSSGKAAPCPVRVRTRSDCKRRPHRRASSAQHERHLDQSGISCDFSGPFALLPLWRRVHLALPPVIPGLLILVRN